MKMKRLLLMALFLCMTSLTYAQVFYYQDHQEEILPHARAAFKQGDYDKAVSLCDIHDSILGREHADAAEVERLRADASRCKDLAFDIEKYAYEGNMTMAELSSDELYKLNPYDERLKLVTTKSYPVPKEPQAPKKPVTKKEPKVKEEKKPSVQPAEPAKPAEPIQPAEPETPVEPSKPVRQEKSGSADDLDDGYLAPYSGKDDFFPPRFVVAAGASLLGIGGGSTAIAPGIGVGMYDIGESVIGAEARAYLSPWVASSTAKLFGVDVCAVLRIVRGVYISAGAGFFSCSPAAIVITNAAPAGEAKPTLGLCIPGGVSFVLGKSFVIQAGVSYFPAVSIGSSKTVKTSAGPSYNITAGQPVMQAGIAPRVSIGFAF